MIRTGLPFGYLFIALFLGAVFLTGAALVVWGWMRQRRVALISGSTMVLGIIGLVSAELAFESAMDWNPSITDDSRISGIWADDSETITLRGDHTFDYNSDTKAFTGSWSRYDWNLRLTAKGVSSTMRFIRFRGELRLMTDPPDDPDMWNGDKGLVRQ